MDQTAVTSPVLVLKISAFTWASRLLLVTTTRRALLLSMSIEAPCVRSNCIGPEDVCDATICLQTPVLGSQEPPTYTTSSKLRVMLSRALLTAVIRSDSSGPSGPMIPVSARQLCLGCALEAEVISDKVARPSTSAIENVILSFM